MKKIFLFFCLVVGILFAFAFYKSYLFLFFVKDRQLITLTLKQNFFSPAKKELLVEVVKQPTSIVKGLSSRQELVSVDGQKIDGMLFVMPNKSKQGFWMKEMLFAIDICWLDDLTLLACEREASIVELDQELPVYYSSQKVNFVLETLPGFFSDQDFRLKLFFK